MVVVPYGPTPRTGTGGQPYTVHGRDWRVGLRAAARPTGTLTLTNTRAVSVDLAGAGFGRGGSTWQVTSDGAGEVRLLSATTSFRVARDGRVLGTTSASRPLTVPVTEGRQTIELTPVLASRPMPAGQQALPATGIQPGGSLLATVALAATAAFARRRRST